MSLYSLQVGTACSSKFSLRDFRRTPPLAGRASRWVRSILRSDDRVRSPPRSREALGGVPASFSAREGDGARWDHPRKLIILIPRERLTRKDFCYLPSWRVEADVLLPGGKGR